ncbi:family 43 glycosylhydrolase [Demequina litorisediminis]|uniref:Glycosyl hydrolases family 43 n=1 Tax=Demequina litorisediminis TaxID=1849022 RepID=A0ABQ6IDQ8_9MICO|nr:family 43 glycosylhydrolase [Demequina litorisediminis]GMA35993.1 hypothetical protein GCM10025876_21970 [Demequina litorisediminis]
MTDLDEAPRAARGAGAEPRLHTDASGVTAGWGARHAHDPTAVRDDDGTYWLFSTDAHADGPLPGAGAQVRRSHDLVTWEFAGWALDGVPGPAREWSGADGLWAPDVVRVAPDEWRMYYSASTFGSRTSAIGLAVAPHPAGPWEDRGIVVATQHARDGHNAIDAQPGHRWRSPAPGLRLLLWRAACAGDRPRHGLFPRCARARRSGSGPWHPHRAAQHHGGHRHRGPLCDPSPRRWMGAHRVLRLPGEHLSRAGRGGRCHRRPLR